MRQDNPNPKFLTHPNPPSHPEERRKRQQAAEALLPTYQKLSDAELKDILATHSHSDTQHLAADQILCKRSEKINEQRHSETRDLAHQANNTATESLREAEVNNRLTVRSNWIAVVSAILAGFSLLVSVVALIVSLKQSPSPPEKTLSSQQKATPTPLLGASSPNVSNASNHPLISPVQNPAPQVQQQAQSNRPPALALPK